MAIDGRESRRLAKKESRPPKGEKAFHAEIAKPQKKSEWVGIPGMVEARPDGFLLDGVRITPKSI